MGKSLGYDFNISLIKRNIYSPKGHAEVENELREIRQLLVKVLKGESPILMQSDSLEESVEQNDAYIKKQMEF